MKSWTSTLSWVLLLGAFLLPAGLFYRWWSDNKQPAAGASSARPAPVFVESGTGGNPLRESSLDEGPARTGFPADAPAASSPTPTSQTLAAAAAAREAAPARDLAPARETPAPKVAIGDVDAVRPVETPPAAAAPAAIAGAPAVAASSAVAKLDVAFSPGLDRDPFVSIPELELMRQAIKRREQEELRRLAEEAAARAAAERNKPRPPSIEERITVQGIIMTPDRTSAIVNNEVLSVGDRVLGAEIVKVTESTVYFKLANKTFSKIVPKR